MKRGREEESVRVFSSFDTALLTHVLSYAWRSTYHLALVSKHFLFITRSRPYWRALAYHALIPMGMPRTVLDSIDVFHGLRDCDFPHFFLWRLLSKRNPVHVQKTNKKSKDAIVFSSFDPVWCGYWITFQVTWDITNRKRIILYLYYQSSPGSKIVGYSCGTFIGYDFIIRLITWFENGKEKSVYGETRDETKTRIWCGMVNVKDGMRTKPCVPFGHFVNVEDFVLSPITWDLLQIKN